MLIESGCLFRHQPRFNSPPFLHVKRKGCPTAYIYTVFTQWDEKTVAVKFNDDESGRGDDGFLERTEQLRSDKNYFLEYVNHCLIFLIIIYFNNCIIC